MLRIFDSSRSNVSATVPSIDGDATAVVYRGGPPEALDERVNGDGFEWKARAR